MALFFKIFAFSGMVITFTSFPIFIRPREMDFWEIIKTLFLIIGAFISAFLISFILGLFCIAGFGRVKTGNFFASSAILFQIISGIFLLAGIVKERVKGLTDIVEINQVPALRLNYFSDSIATMIFSNLAYLFTVFVVMFSLNTDDFSKFQGLSQLGFSDSGIKSLYIVIPLYVITSLFLFRKAKRSHEIVDKINTDNEYLSSTISPLFYDWKNNFDKKFVDYNISHMVDEFNTRDTDTRLNLTNTDMYKESSKILDLLDRLKYIISGDNEDLSKQLKLDLDLDNYSYDSMRAFSENISKGFRAEEIMMKKIGHLDGLLDNITLEKNGQTVELDAILVNDDGVHLIEVKNYSADTIIFESSGMAYRNRRNHSEKIDILDQVSRARNIIRDIIGPNINIYNVIVFADNNTKVIDHMNNENIKVVHMDLLSFLFQNQTNHKPENKDIENLLLESRVEERKYDFYDVTRVKSDFLDSIDRDIQTLHRVLDYIDNSNLTDMEIKKIKTNLNNEISQYKFRRSDRRLILRLYEDKLNKIRGNIKHYFQSLDKTKIKNIILHLEDLKGILE